jgi:hypothetical protein
MAYQQNAGIKFGLFFPNYRLIQYNESVFTFKEYSLKFTYMC